jgi:hypothetical protein
MIAQYALINKFKLELSSFTEQHLTKLKVLHTQREKIVKAIRTFGNNKETELFGVSTFDVRANSHFNSKNFQQIAIIIGCFEPFSFNSLFC